MITPRNAEIRRSPLVCSRSVKKFFRYKDLFQLVPPADTDPEPANFHDFGCTLEYAVDMAVGDRESDIWAHDCRDRDRFNELRRKVRKPSADTWLESDENHRRRLRQPAIAHEICRLLSLLTNYTFQEAKQIGNVWVIDDSKGNGDPNAWTARHVNRWYPSLRFGPNSAFTELSSPAINRVEPEEYYSRQFDPDLEQHVVEIPTDIEDRIDSYLQLPPPNRIAMARSMEHLGLAKEMWGLSRSLSLVAAVFAVEALNKIDDPKPEVCPKCNNLVSSERCEKCHAPKFGLRQRFRQFVNEYSQSGFDLPIDVFDTRSAIAHGGQFLRLDEFDSQFTAGGKDNQQHLEYGVTQGVRFVLLNWLASQASKNDLGACGKVPT